MNLQRALQRTALLVLLVATPLAGFAAEEVRVPIDDGARLERIDVEMARRLGLFGDTNDFRSAQLFEQADGTFVLEIESERGGRLVRERRPLTTAEVAQLRQDVSARLSARPQVDPNDRRGRVLLLAGTSLLGLGFYDWAVPVAADLNDKNAIATGMLAAAGSFFVPFVLTRNAMVTPGMAHLTLYGGTRGIVHGILVHELLNANRDSTGDSDDRLWGGFAGSVVEAVGGYFWARGAGFDTGTTHAIGTSADFGLAYAMAVAEIADKDDAALDGDEGGLQYAAGLAGAAGGLWAGHWLAGHRRYTWGDVEVARMAGLVGTAAGIAIADVADTDDEDWWLAAGMLGGASALVIGDRLVAGKQYAPGPALLVDLGSLGGAALGLGLAYLLSDDNGVDDSSVPYTTAGALGGAAGFAILYATTRGEASRQASAGSPWHVELNPVALVRSLRHSPGARANPMSPSIVCIRRTF